MAAVKHQRAKGFTLIEVLIAIVLIGVAIAALVASNAAFTQSNAAGTELSTAEFLIEQIKELTATRDYDDVVGFDGDIFSPPIDVNSQPLIEFTGFVQQVTVVNVNPADFDQVVADPNSDFIRVTVEVLLNGRQISSQSWIRANY